MTPALTADQRHLLDRVTDSIFANPFTSARRQADSRITGLDADTDPALLLAAVMERARQEVARLRHGGHDRVTSFAGPDRRRAANLFVFDVFHRHLDDMDRHIREQNKTATPCTPACGDDILRDLEGHGFTPAEADRYLALFFQMRRAFFFISTTLIGISPCMQQLRARLWNTIFSHDIGIYADLLWDRLEDFSTLLLGETGTGKGLVAAAIGRSGFIPYERQAKRFQASFTEAFLALNLSQYPEQLIESELFGHARGAFTGAVQARHGIFARSSPHGAVFLDEIGEVSIPVQVKLLRVLQERTFTPVGSDRQQRFAGRVIAATNRDMRQLRASGKFRKDFFYRLSSDVVTIPPLRKRLSQCPEELDLLAAHLLARIAGRQSARLQERVLEALHGSPLEQHLWPGNVRELEQAIRRILLHGEYRPDHAERISGAPADLAGLLAGRTPSARELTATYCRLLYDRYGTYQEVARRTGLDRRTVRKYLAEGQR